MLSFTLSLSLSFSILEHPECTQNLFVIKTIKWTDLLSFFVCFCVWSNIDISSSHTFFYMFCRNLLVFLFYFWKISYVFRLLHDSFFFVFCCAWLAVFWMVLCVVNVCVCRGGIKEVFYLAACSNCLVQKWSCEFPRVVVIQLVDRCVHHQEESFFGVRALAQPQSLILYVANEFGRTTFLIGVNLIVTSFDLNEYIGKRGKGKKKKRRALMKLLLIGAVLKAKIELLLKIIATHLQVKFFVVAVIGLIVNIARFWVDLKRGQTPQKVCIRLNYTWPNYLFQCQNFTHIKISNYIHTAIFRWILIILNRPNANNRFLSLLISTLP